MNPIQHIQDRLKVYYREIEDARYADLEIMKDLCEQLLRFSYKVNDSYGQAYAYLYMAIYYISMHKQDPAKFHIEKAKRLCVEGEYSQLLLLCYRNEGILYQLQGDRFQAIHIYREALVIAEKHKDNTSAGILCNNIAIILTGYSDYELAKTYYEKAIVSFKESVQADFYLLRVYTNLIQNCCEIDDIDNAIEYYNIASTIRVPHIELHVAMKTSEIRLYAQQQKKEQMLYAYEEFLDIMHEHHVDAFILISEFITIAQSMLLINEKAVCLKLLRQIDEIFDNGDTEIEKQIHKLHVNYFECYGDAYENCYKEYYDFLEKSEEMEYESLAKSMQSKMELFEKNQRHSLLLQENEDLQKKAHLDEVSGVYNRRYFDKLITKIESDKNVQSVACIMIDVDYFKEYNDTYGHLAGDQVLRQIADILKEHALPSCYVGRYGGDEFYCLCADIASDNIHAYLCNVFKQLEEKAIPHVKGVVSRVSISVGYAYSEQKPFDFTILMERADQGLYKAKEKGRNTFCEQV